MSETRSGPSGERPPSWRSWLRRTPTWIEVAGLLLALAAIVVPLAVATGGSSSGTAASATTPGGERTGQGGTDRPPAELKVDSFTAGDGHGEHPHPTLEAVVHNFGGTRAVIDGARVDIEAVYELGRCAPQGDIPLSETYGVVLPHEVPTEPLTVPLHDQVAPDGVDRLAIELSTQLSAAEPGTQFLYRLDVSLDNDGPDSPLPLGTAWVSVPRAPTGGEYFWTPEVIPVLKEYIVSGTTAAKVWGHSMACWRRNTAILRRTLRLRGVRSPLLQYASGPLVEPSLAKLE